MFRSAVVALVACLALSGARSSAADAAPVTLESGPLAVTVAARGAELQSIRDVSSGYEYLWQNEPGIWKGPAPILFPVIGGLRDKSYRFEDRTYPMPFHGFARGEMFRITRATASEAEFVLESSAATQPAFPFRFSIAVTYRLDGRRLSVAARIANLGTGTLPASVGFHPGFNATIAAENEAPRARLEIASAAPLVQLTKAAEGGFLDGRRILWSDGRKAIPLLVSTPGPEALVLETHAPVEITLIDDAKGRRVTLSSTCPNLGIWRKPLPDAQFICIEPWWGTTDTLASYDDLRAKPGMQLIGPGATFEAGYTLTLE